MDEWDIRIVRYGVKSASEFQPNPDNPKTHPFFQRLLIGKIMKKIGWVIPVLESERTGYLLDGHDRIEQLVFKNPAAPVPYAVVRLTEQEESYVLATFDAVTLEAEYDKAALAKLRTLAENEPPEVRAMLDKVIANAPAPRSMPQILSVNPVNMPPTCPCCGRLLEDKKP